MNTRDIFQRLFLLLALCAFVAGVAACTGGTETETGPRAWIDVPVDGLTVPEEGPINIEGHAASTDGVSQVEIWVNGELQFTIESPPFEDGLARFSQSWTPPGPGEYTIQVVAFSVDGETSQPDHTRVIVGGDTMPRTEVPSPTPTPPPPTDITPTPTPPPPADITPTHTPPPPEDITPTPTSPPPEDITPTPTSPPPADITPTPTPPPPADITPTPTPTPLTPTPTPTPLTPIPDTTPPPIPSPAVPANGLELTCRSTQTLAWLPVDDPSGIAGYYVKLELEVKPGAWQSAGGYGPISGKQVDVNVNCGVRYRWMVRAQDGAGNISDWSAPSYFSITLN